MSGTETVEPEEIPRRSLRKKVHLQHSAATSRTILVSLLAAFVYFLIELVPMPHVSVGFFEFGLIPTLAIVAVAGAIRGSLAGFLTGYLGRLLSDFLLNGTVAAFTLYAFALGMLGLVVGLANYDFTGGRSLAKLSVMSAIGLVFTILFTVVVGLMVERVATIAAIGFQLVPLVTKGLPSVILLTPLLGRLWGVFSARAAPEAVAE
ncbi:MAG: ECF transporter S component [Candidatus Thorarchaeota archaeon]|nr:MAG: ECF transporter S component [Candidatus Thorarchaeota archaeon]